MFSDGKFEANFCSIRRRHYSGTVIIASDVTKTDRKLFVVNCMKCIRKKSVAVSSAIIKAEESGHSLTTEENFG